MDLSVLFKSEKHYHTVRDKLITYFARHESNDPEGDADECLERVIEKLANGEPPVNVDEFVYGFARNIRRERWRDPWRFAEPDPGDSASQPDSTGAVAQRSIAEEVIGKLTPSDRNLLEEHFLEKKKWTLIAKQLGITASGLRARASRIRKAVVADYRDQKRRVEHEAKRHSAGRHG